MEEQQSATLMINIQAECGKKSSASTGDLVVIAQVVAYGIANHANMDIVSFSVVHASAVLATVVYVHHGHTAEEIATLAGGITADPRTPNPWRITQITSGSIPYILVTVS